MLDERLYGHVVVAADGGEIRVGTWALGEELLVARICRCGVLRNGGLDAFDSKPVGLKHRVSIRNPHRDR